MALANVDITYSAPRRRNVSPKSSLLHRHIKDVDCSGMTITPEDGELIVVNGGLGTTSTNDFVHATDFDTVGATYLEASNLRMVWGSALRSDRSASGQQRVATFHGGHVEVDCKLFNTDANALLGAAGNYAPGEFVTALPTLTAIEGAAIGARLAICPMADNETGWAIGTVMSVSQSTAFASAGDSVRVRLFDHPIQVYAQ